MKSVSISGSPGRDTFNLQAHDQSVSHLSTNHSVKGIHHLIKTQCHFDKDSGQQLSEDSIAGRVIRRRRAGKIIGLPAEKIMKRTKDGGVRKHRRKGEVGKSVRKELELSTKTQTVLPVHTEIIDYKTKKVAIEIFSILSPSSNWSMGKFTDQQIQEVRELLNSADVDMCKLFQCTNKDGITIMMAAVIKRDIEMVRVLVGGISSDKAKGRKVMMKVLNQFDEKYYQRFYQRKVSRYAFMTDAQHYGTLKIKKLFDEYSQNHNLVMDTIRGQYVFREDMSWGCSISDILPVIEPSSDITMETVGNAVNKFQAEKKLKAHNEMEWEKMYEEDHCRKKTGVVFGIHPYHENYR